MSEEKQIEEMAKIIGIPCYKRIEKYGDGSQECPSPLPCNECTAELLYNAGYRKQSENMVEVVRCKDCINRVEFDTGRYHCELTGYYCGETGYCSVGARK